VNEGAHGMAMLHKAFNQMTADESARSGYEYLFHVRC
jgi:hypothetical protein